MANEITTRCSLTVALTGSTLTHDTTKQFSIDTAYERVSDVLACTTSMAAIDLGSIDPVTELTELWLYNAGAAAVTVQAYKSGGSPEEFSLTTIPAGGVNLINPALDTGYSLRAAIASGTGNLFFFAVGAHA